jgi:hypothetical protein
MANLERCEYSITFSKGIGIAGADLYFIRSKLNLFGKMFTGVAL